jgi:hypothetical protein
VSVVKYVLHPSHITSKNDKDQHYIDAGRLARLYGVKLSECVVYLGRGNEHPELLHLWPRYQGDYEGFVERRLKRKE